MESCKRLTLRVLAACLSVVLALLNWATCKSHGQDTQERAKAPTRHARTIDDMLLFMPSKYPDGEWKPKHLAFEDVWFESNDGTKLHGWYCPCKKPRGYVVYAHGNAGNLSDRLLLLQRMQSRLNLTVLIFDYRGYGRSEGVPSTTGAIEDTRSASKFLAKKAKIKESELILMGRSLGGAMVIQIAQTTNPKALIVESTFSSLKDIAKYHYPKLAWLVPANKLDSKSALKKYQGPLLISHGAADRVIPFSQGRELHEVANQPKSIVKIAGGGHNSRLPESYYQRLSQFVDELSDRRK